MVIHSGTNDVFIDPSQVIKTSSITVASSWEFAFRYDTDENVFNGFYPLSDANKATFRLAVIMAPFYEMLNQMSIWLVKRGIKRDDAQKYITSLFVALSEDAVIKSKKDLKNLVKESQTPGGLNEQGVKEFKKAGFYRSIDKTLNSILKRLNKV